MVLTRAQRAQTKTTPPDTPTSGSALSKAPAKRGAKTKKADPEPEQPAKPTTKRALKAKNAEVPSRPSSRVNNLSEVKAKAAGRPSSRAKNVVDKPKAAPARPSSRSEKAVKADDVSNAKETELKTSTSRSRAATGRTKASEARATAASRPASRAATLGRAAAKASTGESATTQAVANRKTTSTGKTTRPVKAKKADASTKDYAKTEVAPEEVAPEVQDDDLKSPAEDQVMAQEESEDIKMQDEADQEPPPPTVIKVMTLSQAEAANNALEVERSSASPFKEQRTQETQDENAPLTSPTKLPRPVSIMGPPTSPFKSSLLSSVQGLGSVRKPPVTGTLVASPTKAGPMLPPSAKPALTQLSPMRMNTSVRDFATVLGSPRRPGSAGSDGSNHSTASTPKRPLHMDDVEFVSNKRLRASISMPSLGSPVRSQASSSDSPPSPTKSSMRSPEKRPNMSPKKVSWHQTPPRQTAVQECTPPPKQPGILDGCVFFLDVNSLTGSNQNNLFAGLIEELGGQYVQQWTHNNMGITHVLFMNGEMRTLEKVLASNGDVYCVSLGWLLDCQRENLRIPENQPRYLIDLTHVPGHTPKPNRSALNTPMTSRTAPVSHTPALPPPEWALPTTPSAPREPLGALSSSLLIKTPAFVASFKTPGPPPSVGMGTIDEHDKENVSPVSEATPLVQKTCPPKQLNRSIFTMSTGISATPMRNKILAGKQQQRRRSFDGVGKTTVIGGRMVSPPRKALGLGSPKRQSPMKRSVLRP